MKWFKHFTDAHDSNDLTKVRIKFGADGYAIYWYCLELIAGDLGTSEKITFDLKHDSEVIAFNLKIDTLRVEEIMRFMVEIGLFEASHGTISCLKLAKYLDKKTTRNNKIHQIIDVANGTVPDSPRLSTLDTDTDTDISTNVDMGKKRQRFTPPSLEEIQVYIKEKNYLHVVAESFFYYYEGKGWMVGKNKMQKWKAAVSNWEVRNKTEAEKNETSNPNSGSGSKSNHARVCATLLQQAANGG